MPTVRTRVDPTENRGRAVPELPPGSRILIVGEDPHTEQLEAALQGVGAASTIVETMTEACECVKTGRFQAVLCKPLLSDGSWRRLIDIANHYDLGFEVVLMARDCDLAAWTEALNEGAFDVLDGLYETPRITQVTIRALWAAYLRGAGPNANAASPQEVA
jgi:DNA-binding NtrC family response regulator